MKLINLIFFCIIILTFSACNSNENNKSNVVGFDFNKDNESKDYKKINQNNKDKFSNTAVIDINEENKLTINNSSNKLYNNSNLNNTIVIKNDIVINNSNEVDIDYIRELNNELDENEKYNVELDEKTNDIIIEKNEALNSIISEDWCVSGNEFDEKSANGNFTGVIEGVVSYKDGTYCKVLGNTKISDLELDLEYYFNLNSDDIWIVTNIFGEQIEQHVIVK